MKVHVVRERLKISKKNAFHLIMHFFSLLLFCLYISSLLLLANTKKYNTKKSAAFIFGEDKKLQNGDFPHDCSFTSLYVCFHFLLMLLLALLTRVCMRITKRKKNYLIRGEEEDFAQIKSLNCMQYESCLM